MEYLLQIDKIYIRVILVKRILLALLFLRLIRTKLVGKDLKYNFIVDKKLKKNDII